MTDLVWLNESIIDFPPIDSAMVEPNGLIAAGGDLSPERLKYAYAHGIFPWFDDTQPILWWSPNPRAVLFHDKLKISRSLMKRLRRNEFVVKVNTCFKDVIDACARPRNLYTTQDDDSDTETLATETSATETWITEEMCEAYLQLHELGYAHSIECFKEDQLVGGLYGVSIGRLFFGESMFHLSTDASKVAFVHLSRLLQSYGCPLIDCQIENPHLSSLGCSTLPRDQFKQYLETYCDESDAIPWREIAGRLPLW